MGIPKYLNSSTISTVFGLAWPDGWKEKDVFWTKEAGDISMILLFE
jgi:hypothetical protein